MTTALAALLLSRATFAAPQLPTAKPAPYTFGVQGNDFVLDGKPYVVHSGEMHYPRVPRALWRDRFRKARAMGLNTICTYVFWNLHETSPGKFDFSGNLDLGEYIKEAGEEGLHIIVRPGPYICTELDFGGLPAWLLKDRTMTVRSKDPKFLAATERYFARVGQVIQPYLPKNGGPILMAQVENEYGSYGADHVYMAAIRDMMKRTGFDLQLFTSDGPGQDMLRGGTLPGIPETVNFGGGAEGAFAELDKFRKANGIAGGPRMIGEYWAGWFDHWGKPHQRSSVANNLKDLEWCLANGVSFNLYMFHGGTNFAFMQGSNGGASDYNVDTTSYDYDSALDESGRTTPKYDAFRKLLIRDAAGVPPVPTSAPTIAIAPVRLEESTALFANLPKPVRSERPMTFEDLDQAHGLVLYRTTTPITGKRTLGLPPKCDFATVFVNDRYVGTIDRRLQQSTIEVDLPAGGSAGRPNRIDVLVEAMSRVNFGSLLANERKGIDGNVTLSEGEGRPSQTLLGWDHYRFPMTDPSRLRYSRRDGAGPRFFRGTLDVPTPGDTFLDLRGWNKGYVWVNGHNLGRFWRIGPQQTLFLPGVWLKPGRNEVVVFDDSPHVSTQWIAGLTAPILDELPTKRAVKKREGAPVSLAGLTPAFTATLKDAVAEETVRFPAPVTARYLALQATKEQRDAVYTTLAELNALDADGKTLLRGKWRVLWVDSEELDSESGTADNVLDNQPTTIWHTQWGSAQPELPHTLVIDLGEEVSLSALRLLPRQTGVNGRIKELRVFTSLKPFPTK